MHVYIDAGAAPLDRGMPAEYRRIGSGATKHLALERLRGHEFHGVCGRSAWQGAGLARHAVMNGYNIQEETGFSIVIMRTGWTPNATRRLLFPRCCPTAPSRIGNRYSGCTDGRPFKDGWRSPAMPRRARRPLDSNPVGDASRNPALGGWQWLSDRPRRRPALLVP